MLFVGSDGYFPIIYENFIQKDSPRECVKRKKNPIILILLTIRSLIHQISSVFSLGQMTYNNCFTNFVCARLFI